MPENETHLVWVYQDSLKAQFFQHELRERDEYHEFSQSSLERIGVKLRENGG